MRRIIDKLLVIVTLSVVIMFMTISFFVNKLVPKDVDTENGLIFGNPKAKVTLVIFEDFKCKYCKQYFIKDFPSIKKSYIDTDKIKYVIMPLTFISGSKLVSNAAIAIYELKKDQFFKFIKIVSEKNVKVFTSDDLIEIAKSLDGINLELFKEFLDQKVFNGYLEENMSIAKKVMPTFEVPTAYINGYRVEIDDIPNEIDERLNLKEMKR